MSMAPSGNTARETLQVSCLAVGPFLCGSDSLFEAQMTPLLLQLASAGGGGWRRGL